MEDDGEGGNNNAPSSSSSAQLLPVSSSAGNANGSSSRGPAAAVEMAPLLVLGAGVVAPRRGSNGNDLESGGGRKVRVQGLIGGGGAGASEVADVVAARGARRQHFIRK